MKRFADTLYRYWYVALLPVIVLPLLTYCFSHATSTGTASAGANIYVTQASASLLDGYNSGQTPAQNLANVLGELLRTASFDLDVAGNSPLLAQTHPGPSFNPVAILSTNLQVSPAGPNLVYVSYNGLTVPETVQVTQSFLDTANRRVAALTAQQSASAALTLEQQLVTAQHRWTSDVNKLKAYLAKHHIPLNAVADRALLNQPLGSLYGQVQIDQGIVGDIQKQLAQAQQPAPQGQSVFQVVDSPGPTSVARGVNKKLLNTLIALAIGLLLGGGFVVVRTALDRSMRYADDATALLGLPVLGVVPYRPLPGNRRRGAVAVRSGGNSATA